MRHARIDEMPRIALACPSFSGGGAERVMVTLANKFIEWGYPVDFVVAMDRGPYKHILDPAIDKYVLTVESDSKVKKLLGGFLRYVTYFRKSRACVCMSTLKEFNVFSFFCKMFSLRALRLYVREADTLDRIFTSKKINDKILLNLMKFVYPKCDGVIANCKVTRDDLLRSIDAEVDVVYNPVSPCGSRLNNGKLRFGVVACGRLCYKKNFKDIISVMPLLKKKIPDIKLTILGEGSERARLEKQVEELGLQGVVEFAGFVSDPYEYYSRAQVFVQTSLWEGFGYVLAEAMTCGTPVVAYDSKGAMREILEDGKYGALTPVGDLQALADAILKKIQEPTPSCVLEEAVSRFDVDVIAGRYLDILGIPRPECFK